MTKFGFRHNTKNLARTIGAIKIAQLMKLSEEDFETFIKRLEEDKVFQLLKMAGAIKLVEFPNAKYSAKKCAGYGLKISAGNLPEIIDVKGDLIQLIQKIGQEKFENYFLKDVFIEDKQIAKNCNITPEDVKRLRDFVNHLFIHSEFEKEKIFLPEKTFSTVAGIEIENGKPVIAFFHREIWKGQYKIDNNKLLKIMQNLSKYQKEKAEKLVKQIELINKRKSTLYLTLEILIQVQSKYFKTGDPEDRVPFSQKRLAKEIGVHQSVINRLISNKSIQVPWGEIPISILLPSSKVISLQRLYNIAIKNPEMTDLQLALELKRQYGINLSRRSIAQYRKELNLNKNSHQDK